MANSIIMPKTGMAMEEGVIVEWRVKEGDQVHKGDVVALIETDKSTMELESDYDGIILAIRGKAGETVPVTRVIAWIGQPGETPPTSGLPAPGAGRIEGRPLPPSPSAPSKEGAALPICYRFRWPETPWGGPGAERHSPEAPTSGFQAP